MVRVEPRRPFHVGRNPGPAGGYEGSTGENLDRPGVACPGGDLPVADHGQDRPTPGFQTVSDHCGQDRSGIQSLFPKREGEAPAEPRIPERPARREARPPESPLPEQTLITDVREFRRFLEALVSGDGTALGTILEVRGTEDKTP
jgi:hypothetical protein